MHSEETGRVARKQKSSRTRRTGRVVAKTGGLTLTEVARLDDLRRQLQKRSRGTAPMRWNADPDDAQKSVAQLVLTLVEFLRQLLERQSIRRMDNGTLTEQQIEDIGRAL